MPTMSMRDDFVDSNNLKRYLANQLKDGKLMLVLGAGISIPFGLPNWEELITNLYQLKGETPDLSNSFEGLAENFKRYHCANNYNEYVNCIHKSLYKNVHVDFKSLRQSFALSAIGALVMSSKRGNISNVITFNFDNLLEIYLRYHGFVTNSIPDYPKWTRNTDVTIHHPHGFIPFSLSEGHSTEIVFDQQSYSRVIGDVSLPWSQLMLTLMRTHTCLFLGLSGSDGNLDSLLLRVNDNHAARQDGTLFWGITFSTDDSQIRVGQWEERGVFYKKVDNYDEMLPAFLLSICEEAAT